MVLEKIPESPLDCKGIQSVHPKGNQSWIFIGRTDAEAETPIFWPPDVKNRLVGKDPNAGKDKMGGEGDDRGWDGWMASPTQRTWVWVGSRSWRWTGKPGVLQSMGSQRVGHAWVTELNWFLMHSITLEIVLQHPFFSSSLIIKSHFFYFLVARHMTSFNKYMAQFFLCVFLCMPMWSMGYKQKCCAQVSGSVPNRDKQAFFCLFPSMLTGTWTWLLDVSNHFRPRGWHCWQW